MSGSARRSRRALAALAITVPLLAVPAVAAAPAEAAGAWSGYGYAYGSTPYGGSPSWWGPGGGLGGGYSTQSETETTTQDATAATSAESTGVVLIDTVVDYGEEEAAGTGLVLSPNGTVVTNHHVVAGATSITVTVPSTGKTYKATVVGYDTKHDVAVLKLAGAKGLSTVTTDQAITTGEAVAAVGNAEGQNELTSAAGTILKRRTAIDVTDDDGSTSHLAGLIEDSSDVVPGDSGGALLDGDDDVVGMTVAASSGTTDVTGYAIPIRRVLTIEREILAGDSSSTITIGSPAALGVEVDSRSTAPYIVAVEPGTGAARAGLAAGDTITSLDGTSVASYRELKAELAKLTAGQRVPITWTDAAGDAHSATITLGTAPIG